MTWDEETELIRAMLSATVRYSTVAASSADGHDDAIKGFDEGGSGDEAARNVGVRRMYPAGFDARPVVGAEAVVVGVSGGASSGVMVGNGRHPDAQALAEGEAVAYAPAEPTCRIWFDKDGVLHIDAKAAKDVVINAGTAKVALHGDSTAGHTHTVTATVAAANGVIPAAVTTSSATDTINIPGTRRIKGA